MKKHFAVFFVCPHCGSPVVRKEELSDYIHEGAKYCSKCGHNFASICEEILAEQNVEQD